MGIPEEPSADGRFIVVLGPSGSGKSARLKLLCEKCLRAQKFAVWIQVGEQALGCPAATVVLSAQSVRDALEMALIVAKSGGAHLVLIDALSHFYGEELPQLMELERTLLKLIVASQQQGTVIAVAYDSDLPFRALSELVLGEAHQLIQCAA